MMIVGVLWREALRFPYSLTIAIGLLVIVLATYAGQAVAIAWAFSAVFRSRADEVWVALAVIVGMALLRLVLSLAQTAAATRLGARVRIAVRRRAMVRALSRDRLHDVSARDGTLRASLGDGIDGTDAYVANYLPVLAQVVLVCPALVLVLALLNPWAGACVGAGVVLALLGPLAWKRMAARRGLDHWDSYEGLSADLLEALRGMATLRVLGDVPGTRARLGERSEGLRRATERVMRVSLAETGVTDFAVQAGVVAAAGTAIVHAALGQAPAIEVYLILLLSSEAFRPVRELSRHWHSGFLGLTAVPGLTRLGAFDTPTGAVAPTESDGPRGGTVASDTVGARRGGRVAPGSGHADLSPHRADQLEITGLSYRYPDAPTAVFDGLDFTARRGAVSAVVGPSGAGKSTLFDLILGFLTPDAGRLRLDGRPLTIDDVAVVSQRPVLFADTLRANLTAAAPTAARGTTDVPVAGRDTTAARGTTDDAIAAACRAADIWEEISTLPHGLDTTVSEAGSNFSGGQRQRLALARALLADRPVLLVDEPTSALDDDRAEAVMETLHGVAAERIVIMISHRPETLEGITDVLALGGQTAEEEVT